MKNQIYSILLIAILFGGCAKKPAACIHLPHENPFKSGEDIIFDGSCSSNTLYYQWFYKDGTFSKISSDPKATHSFTTPGTYSVKLKAEGKNSNESNIEIDVVITP